jgi:anti-sigma-K factor RskA
VTPEEREELLASYALGTLSGPDAAEVEALVRADPRAAEQLASYHDFVDLIALSVPLKRADPSLRDRVLRAARRDRRRGSSIAAVTRWAPAAAAAAVLAVVAFWAASLQTTVTDLREDTAALTAVLEAQAKQIEDLTADDIARDRDADEAEAFTLELRDEQQTMIGILSDPSQMVVELTPTSAGHGASGRYYWSALEDAGMVTAWNLPPLPLGASYIVWVEDQESRQMLTQTFIPDLDGAAKELLRGAADAEPVRVYVATQDFDGNTGVVVLQGVFGR